MAYSAPLGDVVVVQIPSAAYTPFAGNGVNAELMSGAVGVVVAPLTLSATATGFEAVFGSAALTLTLISADTGFGAIIGPMGSGIPLVAAAAGLHGVGDSPTFPRMAFSGAAAGSQPPTGAAAAPVSLATTTAGRAAVFGTFDRAFPLNVTAVSLGAISGVLAVPSVLVAAAEGHVYVLGSGSVAVPMVGASAGYLAPTGLSAGKFAAVGSAAGRAGGAGQVARPAPFFGSASASHGRCGTAAGKVQFKGIGAVRRGNAGTSGAYFPLAATAVGTTPASYLGAVSAELLTAYSTGTIPEPEEVCAH